jgi:hypothetical protein
LLHSNQKRNARKVSLNCVLCSVVTDSDAGKKGDKNEGEEEEIDEEWNEEVKQRDAAKRVAAQKAQLKAEKKDYQETEHPVLLQPSLVTELSGCRGSGTPNDRGGERKRYLPASVRPNLRRR